MKVKIELHQDIYPLVLIEKAIDAYHNIATIKFTKKGAYYICTFNRCKYDPIITKNEFANYLIDLANSRE